MIGPAGRCPPCPTPDACYCDEALRLQEEFEGRASYPFVRRMECRRCRRERRFVLVNTQQGKFREMWGCYRDTEGHVDHIPLNAQDYATLTSSESSPEQLKL